MIGKVLETCKQHEVLKGADLKIMKRGLIEKRQKDLKVKGPPQLAIFGSLASSTSEEKLQAVTKELESDQTYVNLEKAFELGASFGNYGEIDNVHDEGKTVLEHKQGEVLLVDVWATWCGPCQKPMAHNQEMLEKNEAAWKDKVKIVAVSVDDDKESVKNRVQNKKWDKIVHLTLLGWKGEHKLIQDFKIEGIPFVCLINKFGKIVYVGHPSQIKLQTRINELIAEEKEPAGAEQAKPEIPKDSLSQNDITNFIQSMTKEKLTEDLKDIDFLCFKYDATYRYEKEASYGIAQVEASVLEGDEESLEKAKKYFSQFKNAKVEIKPLNIKYVQVPQEEKPQCWKCNQALTFPYYWLKWEEGNKFGCRKCVEAKSTEEGQHYAYKNNSILLTGKWSKIEQEKLGKNIQPEDLKNVDGHGYGCNCCGGCSGQVGEARMICLGCRPAPNFNGDHVDVCLPCFEKVLQGDAETLKGLEGENYEPNYPWLRVLYNTKGYYEF